MKSPVQIKSEHTQKCEANESQYLSFRDLVGHGLQKAFALKVAVSTLELKLDNAMAEFEQELKTIEGNFSPK